MKTTSVLKGTVSQSRNFLASREWLTLTLFILIHVLIFKPFFHLIYPFFHLTYPFMYSEINLFYNYAGKLLSGLLPYRDFTLEYPPLTVIFFGLPRLITSSYALYAFIYQSIVLVFDIIALLLIFDIARRLREASWKPLLIYTLSVLVLGPIIIKQLDLFPAVMTLAALYLFWLGKHKTSWALLALGTLTKVYPIVIAPIFLIIYFRNRQFKQIRDGLMTFCAVCLIIVLPFIILGSDSIVSLINYHGQRGIQLESTYSALILALAKMGFTTVTVKMSFGSYNVVNPVASVLATFSTYITAVSLLIVYWFVYRQVKRGESQFTRLGAYALLTLVVTMATSKVLSPQYFVWLIPIFAIVCGRWRTPIFATFLFVGILTYYIWPLHYLELVSFKTDMVMILVVRNILLVLLAVLAAVSLTRMDATEEAKK